MDIINVEDLELFSIEDMPTLEPDDRENHRELTEEDISLSIWLNTGGYGLQALLKAKAKADGYHILFAQNNGFNVEQLAQEDGAYLVVSTNIKDRVVRYSYRGNKTNVELDFIEVTAEII